MSKNSIMIVQRTIKEKIRVLADVFSLNFIVYPKMIARIRADKQHAAMLVVRAILLILSALVHRR